MKTVNRECIPAGTTHMCDDVFVRMNDKSKNSGWCKVWFEGKWHRNGYLSNCVKIEDLITTETPEEKEALDAIEKVEWKNGDSCRYANDTIHEYIYIGEHPHGDGHYVFSEDKGVTYIANGYLLEPETPEAKKEREELELINEVSEMLNAKGFGHDKLLLKCLISHKYLYRKGE